MKNIWKTVSALLCTVLLISAPAQVYATEKTAADYKEEIREKKEQAEEHKQEIQASESKVDMMEETVAGLNSEKKELQVAKDELSATVEELDAQLTNVQEVLTQLEEDIDRKTKQVENIKNRLREAEANQDEQYASMKQRIKFMYEKGDTAYITMVFGATKLIDFKDESHAMITMMIPVTWQYVGFYFIILITGLNNISEELYEAATIDGAGRLQKIRYISLPLLHNVICTCGVLAVTGALKVFDLPWIMFPKGMPSNSTWLTGTYMYYHAFESHNVDYSSTISILIVVLGVVTAKIVNTIFREKDY